jgi:hypothetical protein
VSKQQACRAFETSQITTSQNLEKRLRGPESFRQGFFETAGFVFGFRASGELWAANPMNVSSQHEAFSSRVPVWCPRQLEVNQFFMF